MIEDVGILWQFIVKLQAMLRKLLTLYLLLTAVSGKGGEPYHRYSEGQLRLLACNYQIQNTATFCGGKRARSCFCSNPYAMATLAGCFHQGSAPHGTEKYVLDQCNDVYEIPLSQEKWEAAYLNYTKYAVTTDSIDGFNSTVPVSVPIILNATESEWYLRSYHQYLGNYNNSLYYGAGLLGYWGLVFVIATVCNWSKYFFPRFTKHFTGPISNAFRKHVSLPALGRKSRTNEVKYKRVFQFLAPTRMETIIIFMFGIVVIGCSAPGYSWFPEDPLFETKRSAMLRFVADRTGIIASICMPLLILFAGRNNFLQWITGWNFATYIAYHRWVARYLFTLVVIHAICFSLSLVGRYKEEMTETYMIWGTIATVSGGFIMIQGLLSLRRRWYEMFLIIHIILAALFIGGAWLHVDDLGYVWFYYATVAVWVFDRVVRLARLAYFGCPKANVTLLANETLKVTVRRPKFWPVVPGGHAFLHFIRPSCFWQSHPFTFTVTEDESENIVMYCKVKGGITHGLYQYLSSNPGKSAQIRVSLEGPYGESTPAKVYDSAVFVAGGNGIPGIYSEVFHLATRSKYNIKQALKLHWVIKDYSSLCWFYDELVALRNTKIQCFVHVTRPNSTTDYSCDEFYGKLNLSSQITQSSSENDESMDKKSPNKDLYPETQPANIADRIRSDLNHIQFIEGRPSIENLVKSEIEESNGSIAFITCGHPVMVDELRYCTTQSLNDSKGKRIDFYEQLQVWA